MTWSAAMSGFGREVAAVWDLISECFYSRRKVFISNLGEAVRRSTGARLPYEAGWKDACTCTCTSPSCTSCIHISALQLPWSQSLRQTWPTPFHAQLSQSCNWMQVHPVTHTYSQGIRLAQVPKPWFPCFDIAVIDFVWYFHSWALCL